MLGDPGVTVLGADQGEEFALGEIDGVEIVRFEEQGCKGVEGSFAVEVLGAGEAYEGWGWVGGGDEG